MGQNPPEHKSPENYRLALVVGGVIIGVLIAYVFSTFYQAPVKTLDLVFWAVGGGLLGLSASLPTAGR